jgi:DNA-binding transcriptional regulator GbsR (MarR family)
MKLTKEEKSLIEALAVSMQTGGLTKAAGRTVGYLLICETGEASFEEIMFDLQLSKGAVSQTLNLLQAAGFVERVKEEGVRKRYYRLCNPAHEQFIESRIQGIRQTQALFQQAKKINAAAGRKSQKAVIDAILEFNGFMAKELAEIKKKWISQ